MPWAYLPGVFNIRDVALLFMFAVFAWLIISGGHFDRFRDPATLMIALYLFLIATHISLALFYYDQPLKHGIIASRTQFFYVSLFFLFAVAA